MLERILITLSLFFLTTEVAFAQQSATLNWDPISGATFNVYRTLGSCPGSPIAGPAIVSGLTAATYTDSTIPSTATQVCYDVTEVQNGVESAISNQAGKTFAPATPIKTLTDPQGTWELYASHLLNLNGVEASTHAIDLRLCNGVVQTEKDDLNWYTFIGGVWSQVAAMCPVIAPVPPPAPTNLTVTQIDQNHVQVAAVAGACRTFTASKIVNKTLTVSCGH